MSEPIYEDYAQRFGHDNFERLPVQRQLGLTHMLMRELGWPRASALEVDGEYRMWATQDGTRFRISGAERFLAPIPKDGSELTMRQFNAILADALEAFAVQQAKSFHSVPRTCEQIREVLTDYPDMTRVDVIFADGRRYRIQAVPVDEP